MKVWLYKGDILPYKSQLDDKATREALAVLEKEYEIFTDPNMLPVKALPRYDTWDRDRTVQQWLHYCA